MAAVNGARKGLSKNATNKLSLVDPSIYDKILTEADRKPVKLKVKYTPAKQSDPGRWNDENKVTGGHDADKKDAAPPPTSPLINQVDNKIAIAFPSGRPFEDTVDIVQCKHCKKPVLKLAAPDHIRSCLRKKQEKLLKKKEAKEAKDAALRKERNGGISPAGSDDESSIKRARKTAVDGDGVAKKAGKKRKAEDDGKAGSAKKKKKDDLKAKKPAKGPVDVEKQCGVPLPNGALCARSLTCKSHSMGAKRAVPGRSAPYDVLLAQYQKKNQAKQQRTFLLLCTQPLHTEVLTCRCRGCDRRQCPSSRRLRTWQRRLGRGTRSSHVRHLSVSANKSTLWGAVCRLPACLDAVDIHHCKIQISSHA
ncbi:hypothetical protein, variant [Verruconis gallopava]|uniref:SCA7 domain-containing protein n=1 Tax=Verruconis gallopava TaxID=253628 RepID=A0A0D2ASB8_9PEZI|nr:hypothetical protein, variant [Verruconis gallopava]KIW02054.1 hypothetical protein, variant [Verruconis gallopava]